MDASLYSLSKIGHRGNLTPNSPPASLPNIKNIKTLSSRLHFPYLWVQPVFTWMCTLFGISPRLMFPLPAWLATDFNFYNRLQELFHQSLKFAQSAIFLKPVPSHVPTRLCFQSILWEKPIELIGNVICEDLGFSEVFVGSLSHAILLQY